MARCDYKIAQRLTPLRNFTLCSHQYNVMELIYLLTSDLVGILTTEDVEDDTNNNEEETNAKYDVIDRGILKCISVEEGCKNSNDQEDED